MAISKYCVFSITVLPSILNIKNINSILDTILCNEGIFKPIKLVYPHHFFLQRQECERSCIFVLRVSTFPLSTILIIDFGIVPTVRCITISSKCIVKQVDCFTMSIVIGRGMAWAHNY